LPLWLDVLEVWFSIIVAAEDQERILNIVRRVVRNFLTEDNFVIRNVMQIGSIVILSLGGKMMKCLAA
jgi:hypothetical protein